MAPSYLFADTLRETVQRLGASDAQPTIADWLVFKRALVLARAAAPPGSPVPQDVETGLNNDWTRCGPNWTRCGRW